jgi:NitT/TauT family transport system ATP-binding protein
VEKVLAIRASYAQRTRPVVGLLQALDAAAAWVDDASNHAKLAEQLARPEYLGVPPAILGHALDGRLELGLGAAKRDVDFMYFHRHAANAPRAADGLWAYAQMVRWGQLEANERAQRAAADVFHPSLYRQSVPAAQLDSPVQLPFDGVEFQPTNVSAYLRHFEVHTPFAATRGL